MVRDAVQRLITGSLSRREFVSTLATLGIGAAVASQFADVIAADPAVPDSIELSDITGGKITCETLKLWGVEYVFSSDAAITNYIEFDQAGGGADASWHEKHVPAF